MIKVKTKIELWIILGVSVLFLLIYARYQFLYTLYFFYLLARYFFPSQIPEISLQ